MQDAEALGNGVFQPSTPCFEVCPLRIPVAADARDGTNLHQNQPNQGTRDSVQWTVDSDPVYCTPVSRTTWTFASGIARVQN
jgi:hypothetical protein